MRETSSVAVDLDHAASRSPGAAALLRGLILLVGSVGTCILAAWMPLLDRYGGEFVLAPNQWWVVGHLSKAAVLAAVGASAFGLIGGLWALLRDQRVHAALRWLLQWSKAHPRLTVLIAFVVALGAVDFYELFYDPFGHRWGNDGHGGLRKQMLREDVQIWLFLAASVMGGLALSAWWPNVRRAGAAVAALAESLSRKRRRWWLAAALIPCVMGAVMCRFALDAMPHFSDSLTYLMQGRMLYRGELSMPTPVHPELWRDSLFFLTEKRDVDPITNHVLAENGQRFFGKYPWGWPAILGTFDHFHVIYLANAMLAGLAAILTGLIAREIGGKRVAILAALAVGLSPWVWFNGSSMASHVASTCALMTFIWLFLAAVRQGRQSARAAIPAAVGCGLGLGAAILIRPGDATNFALPVAVVTLYLMLRRPRQWLAIGPFMAIGPLAGAAIYLWINSQLTGSARISPYKLEPRWITDWDARLLPMAARSFFEWVELNGRFPGWGIGGMTVAVVGLIAFVQRQGVKSPSPAPPLQSGGLPSPRPGGGARGEEPSCAANIGPTPAGLWLLIAATVVFFFFNTAFGLTNVWWGPRWLMPVVPLLAILAAFLVDNLIDTAGGVSGVQAADGRSARPDATAAAQFALLVVASGLLVGLAGRYGGQFYQNQIMPPHAVSGAVDRQVRALGLHHAVVVMDSSSRHGEPVDARGGIYFMNVPLEANDVVYVRAIPQWEQYVKESLPGRVVYRVVAPALDLKREGEAPAKPSDPLGFEIRKVD